MCCDLYIPTANYHHSRGSSRNLLAGHLRHNTYKRYDWNDRAKIPVLVQKNLFYDINSLFPAELKTSAVFQPKPSLPYAAVRERTRVSIRVRTAVWGLAEEARLHMYSHIQIAGPAHSFPSLYEGNFCTKAHLKPVRARQPLSMPFAIFYFGHMASAGRPDHALTLPHGLL